MFQNLIARIKDDDNPRLHRIPFFVIWVAAYGLAYLSMVFGTMILSDIIYELFYTYWLNDNVWFTGALLGLIFGLMLSLIQTWIMRRRYGFVPRFWRIGTLLGSIIGAFVFFVIVQDHYEGVMFWLAGVAWFGTVTLFQALVMFRVNRQSWLLAATGLLAGGVAAALEGSNFAEYNSVIWAILIGSAIQSIGTGFVVLRLMANPREGIVPKRESDEKAKSRMREGLHPFTFIGFWAAAYFMGWVTFMVLVAFWFLTIGDMDFMYRFYDFIEANFEWGYGLAFGSVIGFASAVAQPWLMKKHSKTEVRHWVLLSTLGWALAGIGLFYYMDNYSATPTAHIAYLAAWFILPTLFQTVSMWRAVRGGWIWVGTGVVTVIIAVLVETQFDWTYNENFYALMIGGVAHAIVTGATFILLKSQQAQIDQQSEALVVEA